MFYGTRFHILDFILLCFFCFLHSKLLSVSDFLIDVFLFYFDKSGQFSLLPVSSLMFSNDVFVYCLQVSDPCDKVLFKFIKNI